MTASHEARCTPHIARFETELEVRVVCDTVGWACCLQVASIGWGALNESNALDVLDALLASDVEHCNMHAREGYLSRPRGSRNLKSLTS